MDKFWSHFKSGTDIRGVAVDAVKDEPLDLTDEVIFKKTYVLGTLIRVFYKMTLKYNRKSS